MQAIFAARTGSGIGADPGAVIRVFAEPGCGKAALRARAEVARRGTGSLGSRDLERRELPGPCERAGELALVQVRVCPAAADEFVVAPLLDDLAVLHDHDCVGISDR